MRFRTQLNIQTPHCKKHSRNYLGSEFFFLTVEFLLNIIVLKLQIIPLVFKFQKVSEIELQRFEGGQNEEGKLLESHLYFTVKRETGVPGIQRSQGWFQTLGSCGYVSCAFKSLEF